MKSHNHAQCPQPQSSFLQVGSGICLPPLEIHVGVCILITNTASSPEAGKGFPSMCHEGDLMNDQCGRNAVLWIQRLCHSWWSPSATCYRFAKETRPAQKSVLLCSSLLLVGLKGFHLQRCPCKRSTSASSPSCLGSRQTENADAQGPPIVPRAGVRATKRVENTTRSQTRAMIQKTVPRCKKSYPRDTVQRQR